MGELELTRAEQINAEHHACEASTRVAIKHALRCGAMLEEQKRELPHGGWLPWLAEHFEGSERTAQAYMRLSRNREVLAEMDKYADSADLSIDGALKELAAPREEGSREEADASSAAPRSDATGVEKHKKARERAERAREMAERELERMRNERDAYIEKVDSQFVEEMAALKAKYGEVDEPRFAHIPPEVWEEKIRNAKSQRVMDVARHLNELTGWPDWMGRYFPDEAAEALEDMERHEDLENGIEYIHDWLGKMIDEVQKRRGG